MPRYKPARIKAVNSERASANRSKMIEETGLLLVEYEEKISKLERRALISRESKELETERTLNMHIAADYMIMIRIQEVVNMPYKSTSHITKAESFLQRAGLTKEEIDTKMANIHNVISNERVKDIIRTRMGERAIRTENSRPEHVNNNDVLRNVKTY
jgi:hypothetical protein